MECRPALCDAGLFHSVYGTDAYRDGAIPFSMRNQVQELIGHEAERIAWLFCVMRRETLAENVYRASDLRVKSRFTQEWLRLTPEQFSDLVNLVIANALEVVHRSAPKHCAAVNRQARTDLLPFRPAAMPSAQKAIDALAGTESPDSPQRWWKLW